MTNPQIPVAIVGATGYAGEGSLRILLGHPNFTVVHAGSDRLAGTRVDEAIPALRGDCGDLVLQADTPEQILASKPQAIILAKKSPDVTEIVPQLLASGVKLIDIGAEFRLHNFDDYKTYYGDDHACPEVLDQAVYGLSEIHTDAIKSAQLVGNPGCYPTSVLIPLIPLLKAGLINLEHDIVSVSYSGVSGAGKKYLEKNNNLFYAMNENIHSYRALNHQHRGEINQELSIAANSSVKIQFIPHLAPITRGIHSTITCRLQAGKTKADVYASWQNQYADRVFTRIIDDPQQVAINNVASTNYIDFAASTDEQTLAICCVEDNLVKGASGQAVQNLNLMFGFAEDLGLKSRSI